MSKQETIIMHNPPKLVLEYVKKWAAHVKKSKNNGPAECAMVDDIVTMVRIGASNMTPIAAPAKPGNNKKDKE